MQNENTNEAVATVELNNLRYSSSGGSDGTYTGKAIANFSRYTDGTWSMTRVTINPDNLFSAKWFDTDVKAPTFVETQMELINKPLVDRGYNTLPPSLVIAILSIPIVGVALLILKDFSNRKTPQSR